MWEKGGEELAGRLLLSANQLGQQLNSVGSLLQKSNILTLLVTFLFIYSLQKVIC